MNMNNLMIKAGLLAVVAALSACSCLKSPDLNVAPVAKGSKYGAGAYAGGGRAANAEDVKSRFAAGNFNIVYFDFDKSNIRDDAAATLQKFAGFAKENGVQGVTIEGNCDERGTREYNLALGDRRAVSVKRYLVGLGMDAHQFTTVSYGKERPVCDEHDESCWSKNRRAVLDLQ
jgi:peptidoglycan-associated lipoprotein